MKGKFWFQVGKKMLWTIFFRISFIFKREKKGTQKKQQRKDWEEQRMSEEVNGQPFRVFFILNFFFFWNSSLQFRFLENVLSVFFDVLISNLSFIL